MCVGLLDVICNCPVLKAGQLTYSGRCKHMKPRELPTGLSCMCSVYLENYGSHTPRFDSIRVFEWVTWNRDGVHWLQVFISSARRRFDKKEVQLA